MNVSDLSASGARPFALVVSFGAPPDTLLEDVLELYAGLNEAGVEIVGGDTTRAEQLYLSVTALGRSARVPGRAGAMPGDLLVVTGPLGGSGAGFRALREGVESPLVAAHLRPPLRVEEGLRLGAVAHAMIDVSDGLAHGRRPPRRALGLPARDRPGAGPPRRASSPTSASARTTSCWPRRPIRSASR